MNDLISRQKAIMDAESWVAVDEYEKHLQKSVIEWLKEFPPTEPSTDMISRQAAIDVIDAGRLTKLIDAETAINGLKKLPPAQLERSRGEVDTPKMRRIMLLRVRRICT